jgi:hypothetical protein
MTDIFRYSTKKMESNSVYKKSTPSIFALLFLFSYFMVACGGSNSDGESITATPIGLASAAPPTETTAPTPSPLPALAVLLAGSNAQREIVLQVESSLQQIAQSSGWQYVLKETLMEEDKASNLHLVVVVAPDPGVMELASALPDTQFIAIGIPGLSPLPNLAILGGAGMQPDVLGFTAGYLSAVITEDWRVGVISANSPNGQAARTGFMNGVVYFCGLCNPSVPPFNEYPIYVETTLGATTEENIRSVDILLSQGVTTIYLTPELSDPDLVEYLAGKSVVMVGHLTPPESARASWVVTLEPGLENGLQEVFKLAQSGLVSGVYEIGVTFSEVNPQNLSLGRQAEVERMLEDLLQGYIYTGFGE